MLLKPFVNNNKNCVLTSHLTSQTSPARGHSLESRVMLLVDTQFVCGQCLEQTIEHVFLKTPRGLLS